MNDLGRKSNALKAAETDPVSVVEALARLAEAREHFRAELGRIEHTTMLPNRTRFIEDMRGEPFSPEAEAGSRAMVLVTLADAKHFNEILRALGHAYSEDFIRAGAQRLRKVLGEEVKIYHVSVLSFAFMLAAPEGEKPREIDAIVRAFSGSLVCQDIPIDTRAGVGLRQLDPGDDPAELLRTTLTAAQASRAGINGWAWYDKSADDAHLRAFTLLTDLKPALASDDQLFLDYQPRICMKSRKCLAVEALLRWRHPRFGLVSPAEFVPLAEATALITPLTRKVIAMAVAQLARWQRGGMQLRVSVNVSPKNMMESDFVASFVETCRSHGVDPHDVEMEFTEGTLSASNPAAMQTLGALNALGTEVAIDDFGSGYSNMSYLTTLPAQTIKIDQSFVRPLQKQPRNAFLIRSVIDLGHRLGYRVVAEGIEDGPTFDMLLDWECDEGQGYFMSRPVAASALPGWVAGWH